MHKWSLEFWNLVRRRGQKDFILTLIVRQAVPTGFLCWLIFLFMLPVYFQPRPTADTAYLTSGEFWAQTLTAAVGFPLAGVVSGAWRWWWNERRFSRERERHAGT